MKLAEGVSEQAAGEENFANSKMLDGTILDSNHYIEEMKSAIDDILHRSNDVAAVIGLIEGGAFQTKMLSINAAIQAAHTGKDSSGFATIAKEIHNLSLSTGDAAQQSVLLIEKCLNSIQQGNDVLDKTVHCIVDIKKFQETQNNLTEQIRISSEHQKSSMEEINVAFAQIMDIVTANSSTAEEMAAIAEEMEEQVQVLNHMISKFRFPKS